MNKWTIEKLQNLVNEYHILDSPVAREKVFETIVKIIIPYIKNKFTYLFHENCLFYDDYIQDATERLFYCLNNYNVNSNVKFITYALSSIVPYVKDRAGVYKTGGLFGSGRTMRRYTKDNKIVFLELEEDMLTTDDNF